MTESWVRKVKAAELWRVLNDRMPNPGLCHIGSGESWKAFDQRNGTIRVICWKISLELMQDHLEEERNENRRDTGREVPVEEKWLDFGKAEGLEKKG